MKCRKLWLCRSCSSSQSSISLSCRRGVSTGLACSEDRRDSAVAVRCLVVDGGGSTVQFIDWVVLFMDKLLTARRCARHALACWRIPVEIPQVQFWDKVFTLVVARRCGGPDV